MSMLKGTISVTRFLALGPVPDDASLGVGLDRDRFRPFEDGLEEARVGWVDWRNHLLIPAESGWVQQGKYAAFALRIDTRKVPASTLKAHVDLKLQRLMDEKGWARVGNEIRLSIQDEVKAEILKKEQPRSKHLEILWDRKAGRVTTTATAAAALGAIQKLFMKSFGVELVTEGVLLVGERVSGIKAETLSELEPMELELKEIA